MKKFLLVLVFVALGLVSNAQLFVAGSISAYHVGGETSYKVPFHTVDESPIQNGFTITPAVGYMIPGKSYGFGLSLGYGYSSLKNKQEIIEKFKNRQIKIMITTSILERGMTFFDVQVIVYDAHHDLFDESSLIQISGRVGRKLKAPTGNVYFLTSKITLPIIKCIKTIKKKNKALV